MTYGDLKRKIRRNRRHGGAGGMSVVNPGLTKDQAMDILENSIAAHPDDQEVTPHDALIAQHIHRECPR